MSSGSIPELPDGIEIGQLDPVDPFHRQNASAGDLAMDASERQCVGYG